MSLLDEGPEALYVEWLKTHCPEGQMDGSKLDPELRTKAERDSAELRKRMAPPGTWKLPPLLEHRRLQFGIPDGAFKYGAVYDRVTVFQLDQFEGQETYGDTMIVRPDIAKNREKESAPRGIVVSAGLKALDNLRSHGIDLGHIISFVRMAPWRLRCDVINGREYHVMVLRDGDLIASEDLPRMQREFGWLQPRADVSFVNGLPVVIHTLVSGSVPTDPFLNEAY